MKKFFSSKWSVGLIGLLIGFYGHDFIKKIKPMASSVHSSNDRVQVDPNDFDHNKLLEAILKMQQEQTGGHLDNIDINIAGVDRKEDQKSVYYDIPYNSKEVKDRELKVSVKNGMISIIEKTKNSESQKEFSIDPGLDEANAKVINEKDKIRVIIPKK